MDSEKLITEKPRCYSILPAQIRYNKNLSPTAKILFSEIDMLSHKNGYCFAANAYFAENFGVSDRQICTCMKQLSQLGFIRIVKEEGQRRIYPAQELSAQNMGTKKTSAASEENFGRGYEENFAHNNINNNKYNNNYNNYNKNNYNNYRKSDPNDSLRVVDEEMRQRHKELERIMYEKLKCKDAW